VVLRARDAQKLAHAKRAVEDMLERVRGAQSSSASALPERSQLATPHRHSGSFRCLRENAPEFFRDRFADHYVVTHAPAGLGRS